MLKASFKNILLYILLKYILFYILLMFKHNDFRLLEWGNLRNGGSVTYFLLIMMQLPVISMFLFSAPIYFAFKLKNWMLFIIILSAITISEYYIYTYMASQLDLMNGVYNEIISLLLLLIFFLKPIRLLIKKNNGK